MAWTLRTLCVSLLLVASSKLSQACPDFCFCFNGMASCSDFRVLDLTLLPADTATLVLSRGELEEIPPAFLARAQELSMLEILSINARVVRGGAFRGIGHLDFFSITNCTFDIVEPEGLSGLNNVEKIHISDSLFGRVGKHGFAEISSVLEFRFWNNKFEYISEEAFYKLTNVLSVQMFQNNITYIGTDAFKGAHEVDDVNIFRNYIRTAEEGFLSDLPDVAIRMVFYNNEFECSCDLVWMLKTDHMKEQNMCSFWGGDSDSTFRVADLPESVMCVPKPSTTPEPVDSYSALSGFFNDTYESQHNETSSPSIGSKSSNKSKVDSGTTHDDEIEVYEFIDWNENYPTEEIGSEESYESTVGDSVADSLSTIAATLETELVTEMNQNDLTTNSPNSPKTATESELKAEIEVFEDIKYNSTKVDDMDMSSNFSTYLIPAASTEAPAGSDTATEEDEPKLGPVVAGGFAKDHATPSAVEMDTTTPANAATKIRFSSELYVLFLVACLCVLRGR